MTSALLCLSLAIGLGGSGAPFPDDSEEIRILIGRGQGSVSIRGADLERSEGAGWRRLDARAADVSCDGRALHLSGVATGDANRTTLRGLGPLFLLGSSVRGEAEISCGEDGRWTAVNVLPLEEYLAAVLGGEMSPSFPRPALEAQAVAARTYAIRRKMEARAADRPWHLDSTALSQIYHGVASEDPRTRGAAESTRGEILAAGVLPAEAYFHASCGGRTETGAAALGRDLPYLQSVSCPCAGHSPFSHWSIRVTPDELARLARRLVGKGDPLRVRVRARTSTGRAKTLEVVTNLGSRVVQASELRAALGYLRLPSLWFDVHPSSGAFVFEGRGAGHGAGLCQWGARAMALEGASYREILAHYYPGTAIVRIY
ncbi:MAG: SpoIID/LytB domain-containing protein [Deltaproteobacteria bacterium]